MAAWDMKASRSGKRDIGGVIDNGWFFDPTYQWGHSSSSDHLSRARSSSRRISIATRSIAAFDVKTGKQLWRTEAAGRDLIMGHAHHLSRRQPRGDKIVTNGPKVRSYDPETGKLLWTLGPNSEVTVGTPVVGDDLVYIWQDIPARPIYAIRPNASGDITMVKEKPATESVGVEQRRGHLHSKPHLLRRHSVYVRQQRRAVGGATPSPGEQHLPQSRRRRRLVRRVSDRRGWPSLLRERRRRRDRGARGTHVRGARQERR